MDVWMIYNNYSINLPKKSTCQLLTEKDPKEEVLLLLKEWFLGVILRSSLKKKQKLNFWYMYTRMGAIAFVLFGKKKELL